MFKCFFGHDWVPIPKGLKECGSCYTPQWGCPHSLKVCKRKGCNAFEGYGSHGKLTVIPAGCKAQAEKMRG